MKPYLKELGDGVIASVKKHVASALEPLNKRLYEMEKRPQIVYRGVWSELDSYRAGDMCTFKGALWHCWQSTKDKPGTSDAWQLMMKNMG